MQFKKYLALLAAAFITIVPNDTAQGSIHFRGVSGSYAASDSQLAGGQSLANWTIELWFKPSKSDFYGLFNSNPDVPWTGIQIGGGDGVFGCLVILNNPNAYYSVSTTKVFTTNEWQLLTIVCNSNTMSAYRNGVFVGSSPLPGNASFAAKHQSNNLGAFDFGLRDLATLPDDGFFNGYLGDFRVWDRALSVVELTTHVTQQPTLPASGLRNWIPFNETTGNQFHDIVSGITGTFYNVDLSTDSPLFNAVVPHRATATSQVVNGFVVGATITDPGFGYTNAPMVIFVGGGGSGATATATVSGGVVTGITITGTGSGYTNTPTIRIASPPFMPWLAMSISKVKVTQHVVLGKNYVLESSFNLQTWSLAGSQFTADDEVITLEFDADVTGRFFRIRQVP